MLFIVNLDFQHERHQNYKVTWLHHSVGINKMPPANSKPNSDVLQHRHLHNFGSWLRFSGFQDSIPFHDDSGAELWFQARRKDVTPRFNCVTTGAERIQGRGNLHVYIYTSTSTHVWLGSQYDCKDESFLWPATDISCLTLLFSYQQTCVWKLAKHTHFPESGVKQPRARKKIKKLEPFFDSCDNEWMAKFK